MLRRLRSTAWRRGRPDRRVARSGLTAVRSIHDICHLSLNAIAARWLMLRCAAGVRPATLLAQDRTRPARFSVGPISGNSYAPRSHRIPASGLRYCARGYRAWPPWRLPETRISHMNGLIRASLGNPHAVTVMSLTFIMLGVLSLTHDPDRHLAGLQEPGRADADVLRRHAGQQHRQRHHQPDGALDRPGQRHVCGRSRGRSSAPASSATTSRATSIPTGP